MSAFDEKTPFETVAARLSESTDLALPENWWLWPNVFQAHQHLSREFFSALGPYPAGRYDGRGVVICAGGPKLFANGWVCMRVLRYHGCTLPIEFWHLDNEIDTEMAGLVGEHGVSCVNGNLVARGLPQPPRILRGWELKSFAILHSRFQEVLLLDADNVAVTNPEFLFESPQYRETGTIFWPDYLRMGPERRMWEATEVPYRDEPEVESGQIVLDKARCWSALSLATHYNSHSDFYFKHVLGDKGTFQFAWARTGTPYSMPQRGIHSLHGTMCQHDFDGRRLFQHRNADKWQLDGSNRRIRDFWLEETCRDFLADLRRRWNGHVAR
jgi:hypothetical protein